MAKVNSFNYENTPKVSLDKSGAKQKKDSDIITKNSLSKAAITGGKSPSHPKGY